MSRKNAHVHPQLYQCEVCKKDFNKKSNYQRHLLIHSALPIVRKPHVCLHCGFNAATTFSLTSHIKRIHTKEFNHICPFCNKGYILAGELRKHVKNQHLNEVYNPIDFRKNEDKDDSKNFPLLETPSDLSVLEPKESLQSPVTSKSFQCEHCDKVFIRKSNLVKHQAVHSKDYKEKVYVCPHCQFKACSSSSLHIHLRRIHTKEFKHVCPHCNKGFAVPREMRRHIEFRHSVNDTVVAIDIIKPTGEGLMCEICNRLLSSLSEVEEHRKKHSHMLAEKKHHCMQCDYSTNYKGDLKRHLRYHLGERRFQCEFCDKAFVERGPLKIHLRLHTGESPFLCTTCGRRFTRHSQLQEHERTHTGEKPYLCDICSKRFTSRNGFNLHKCRQQRKTSEGLSMVSQDFPFCNLSESTSKETFPG